ncbi:MAG: ABC transporter permease [Dongiaceae bacterium]
MDSAGVPVGHLRRLWLYLLAGLIMLFLMAPTLIVVPMSFSGSDFLQFPPRTWSTRWYGAYADSLEWRSATWISLQAAISTVLLATPLGTAAAYGLNATRSRLAGAVLVALTTPMVVPVIFVAIGAFYLYARLGLLNSVTGLVLAHSTLAMPFVVALVAAGLKGHDPQLERAARSLGASRARAFFSVTLPQIRFSVMSAALLAFLTSFDEVVVALLVAGSENATITRRMFTMLRDQIDPSIAAISSLMIGLSMALGLLLQALRAARPRGRR